MLEFLGEACVFAVAALVRPRHFRFGDFALAFQRASFDGIPVTSGVEVLMNQLH